MAVEAGHTVADLAAALASELGIGDVGTGSTPALSIVRLGGVANADTPVHAAGLLSGDDVLLLDGGAPHPSRVAPIPLRAVTVDLLTGPEAGTSMIVMQGTYRVGRDPAMDISINDPTVSLHQLDLTVTPSWTVEVTPAAHLENPVTVNGEPITDTTTVSSDDVIGIGTTRLASRRFVRVPVERVDQLGQIEFQRTPYRPVTVTERRMAEIGPVPHRPDPRRFQVLAVLTPVLAGVVMVLITKQLQYLALTALSPVAMVATWFEDRRSGRGRFAHETTAFGARLDQRSRDIAGALAAERVERLRAAPDLAELTRRAELHTVDLWARGRQAPDFLTLRLGLGRTATRVVLPDERITDEQFRAQVAEAAAAAARLDDVPITADVRDAVVLAIHGHPEAVLGAASACIVQAAALHSPEDLTIVAAVHDESPMLGWLKWLPHTRSVTSPLGGTHVVRGAAAGDELITQLLEVAEFRISLPDRERADRSWPRLLVVLEAASAAGRVDLDQVALSKLLDLAPTTGIHVLWLAEHDTQLPRQARTILRCTSHPLQVVGTLWSTDPTVPTQTFEVDQLRTAVAARTARALAPVRDASSGSAATSIPRLAPLLDVLGVAAPTAAWVTDNWTRSATQYALRFPVGFGASGPLWLDLVDDGPHTLIGGTSGAGKSELLQSMVAALAAHHDPTRLNFLFVDYKGGASSTVFTGLAHTVGYVTNLSAELSLRALTSLRAELNRRMRVMEGRAKDLREMIELYPHEAPASLVIVVDEFATLVKEVPEFVAGVVDIAQRGRSLDIHLVLATQRPSGSVNDNILANTNLRISLRMLDRGESSSIIGSPEAADIPVPLRGRGLVRLGPRTLVPFQSSYCSAPLLRASGAAPVLVGPFVDDRSTVRPAAMPAEADTTHLDAILAAVADAVAHRDLPPPRQPWRDVLADELSLDAVLADRRATEAVAHPGRIVPLGMLDVPEEQDQYPLLVDLEAGGGCLVFGSGGSGKTTLLRTAAAAAARLDPGGRVVILGLDFASRGLASIGALPNVIDVATGDDLEAVTRHIAVLEAELMRRRALLATARAEDLTAYLRAGDRPALPRIMVLIDSFGGLTAAFSSGATGSMSLATPMDAWLEIVNQIVVDGRQVGIHAIATADRRGAIPQRLHSAISNRVILRHADENGYTDHGIPATRAKQLVLPAGRGLWQAAHTVQIAVVGHDATSPGQARALAEVGDRSPAPARSGGVHSAPLPDVVAADDLAAAPRPMTIPVGVADITGDTVMVDIAHSHLLIVGPPVSGRTTAAARCVAALSGDHEVWSVSATGPAPGVATGVRASTAPAGVEVLLQELADATAIPTTRPRVLVVDDLDRLDESAFNLVGEQLIRAGVRIVATIETRSHAGYSMSTLLAEVRKARKVIFLQPADATEVVQMFGVRPPLRPGLRMPAGRGVVIDGRTVTVTQIATP